MHNRALHDTLAAFVEEAAWQLAEEVAAGAEVPFELIEQGRASAPLYCYRPLTDRFIAEHLGMLERLPSYPAARQNLQALPNLGAYLIARGRRAPAGDRRAMGDSALEAFITALWGDATEFVYDRERFAQVYGELEEAVYDGCSLSVVLAPVEGLVIDTDEVPLGEGSRSSAATRCSTPPPTCTATTTRRSPSSTSSPPPASSPPSSRPAAACAGCRPRCGCGTTPSPRSPRSPGRARTVARGCRCRSPPACGGWTATASSRPRKRIRCARSARSSPAAPRARASWRGRCAGSSWAASASRHGRPSRTGCCRRARCSGRASACATASPRSARRPRRANRWRAACGTRSRSSAPRSPGALDPALEGHVEELGSHLRAILRDVLCGHLDPALRTLADGLLASDEQPAEPTAF